MERILLSVVLAGFSGVDSSILYLSCRRKDTQKVFGIYHSTVGLLIAASVFSVFVLEDYALAALLTVVSYGVAALLSLGLTEVKQRRPEKWEVATVKDTIGKVVRDRSVLLFLIAVAFLSETHQTITVFLNQLQYERVGLESSAIYPCHNVGGLWGVVNGRNKSNGRAMLLDVLLRPCSDLLPDVGFCNCDSALCSRDFDPAHGGYVVSAASDGDPE